MRFTDSLFHLFESTALYSTAAIACATGTYRRREWAYLCGHKAPPSMAQFQFGRHPMMTFPVQKTRYYVERIAQVSTCTNSSSSSTVTSSHSNYVRVPIGSWPWIGTGLYSKMYEVRSEWNTAWRKWRESVTVIFMWSFTFNGNRY